LAKKKRLKIKGREINEDKSTYRKAIKHEGGIE
jgi:hypothetical protein